jgi:streptomycin 6-kinase
VDELTTWIDRWNLILDGEPFQTPSSVVVFARRAGEPVVLKVVNPASDEGQAPAALRLWGGNGAVRLIEWDGRASLIERAAPGTPLAELVADGRDDEATAILADTKLRLRHPDPPEGDWPTVEKWGEGFARQRRRGPHPLLPAALLDRGEAVFGDLCRDPVSRLFLHGDLHHTNVLRDETRGWLAIDPKGVIGDPALEPAMSLRNPIGLHPFAANPKVMARRVAIYAERLHLQRPRILGWALGQLVLCICWHIEDGDTDRQITESVAVAEVAGTLFATV